MNQQQLLGICWMVNGFLKHASLVQDDRAAGVSGRDVMPLIGDKELAKFVCNSRDLVNLNGSEKYAAFCKKRTVNMAKKS
jgi:hypothetical protein